MINLGKNEWVILLGLLLLSLIPSAGGIARLVELVSGAGFIPVNPRIHSMPLPVVFHISSSVTYCILGAFQFLPGIRRRYSKWHRFVGRLLIGAGIVSALSGLWMTRYYPFPIGLQGNLLFFVRIIVGSAMIAFILCGLAAVLQRRFLHHQAWMIRAYALGQGAGTQVLITIPFILTIGEPSGINRDILMTTGWLINIIAAEMVVRRLSGRRNISLNKVTPIELDLKT